jgi:NitT/TauT family transport system substrate-binding protein
VPLFPSTRRAFVAVAAVAALTTVTACTGDDGSDDNGSQDAPDQVTYLTGFGASAHDAFIFVADEKGFFDAAGIDIDIQLGGGNENYGALLADEAQFTYIDYTGVLVQLGRGEYQPGDFRALSAVHQNTLVAVMAPESSDIDSPQDLSGQKIGAFTGSPTEFLLPAYADLVGFDYDPEEQLVSVGIQELFGVLPSGQADALSSFIIQRGVIEQAAGEPMVVFPMNEVLDDLLGTGLMSTTALADENPELVERFRDAALEGLEYTINNPEEAIQILSDRNPGAIEVPEPFVAQIGIMEPYITARGADQIGVMDEAHVMRCISVLESAGLIPPGIGPDAIIGEQTLLTST